MTAVLARLNEGWAWAGTEFCHIHEVSPMGHLVLSDEQNCFHYLDTDSMRIVAIGNQAALAAYFADPENKEVWEARGLVEPAREKLGDPSEGNVFTLRPDCWVTGDYSVENMCHLPLEEIVYLSGDLARQLKDVPDGATVQIKITD